MKAGRVLASEWGALTFSSSTIQRELRQGLCLAMRLSMSDSERSERNVVAHTLAVTTLATIIGAPKLLPRTLIPLQLEDLHHHQPVLLKSFTFAMSLPGQLIHDGAGHQSFVLTASREPYPRSAGLILNTDKYAAVPHLHHRGHPNE